MEGAGGVDRARRDVRDHLRWLGRLASIILGCRLVVESTHACIARDGWYNRGVIYARLDASEIRARAEALERFARWQRRHPARLDPAVALEGVAALYELLPVESRTRAIDPAGVVAMHEALKVLGPR